MSSSPARRLDVNEHWLSPDDLLVQLEISPGLTVGEIGAGNASFTLPIARQIGPESAIRAIEWRSVALDSLRTKLAGPDTPCNVHLVESQPGAIPLADESCDLLIFPDVWHEMQDHNAALDEAKRILRPDGRLAILNWCPQGSCPPGPPLEHRVSMRDTVCTVEMKSWSLVKTADDLTPHGYLLVFEITDESVQS